MATKKKLLQAAAGSAGGAGLNVEEVFSTYLYEGNGSTQTITNGIDLSGEGGLVWLKNRGSAVTHALHDTERGPEYILKSNSTAASDLVSSAGGGVSSFNSDGFSLYADTVGLAWWNASGQTYASWTFRKAPKFFDVVTYTGNGTNQTISHNLGSAPGTIIVKRTDASTGANWLVYHRAADASAPEGKYLMLNKTNAVANSTGLWNNTAPTSTEFSVGNSSANTSGGTYVAYLFAHNDGDGEFGPDGDADIIKCGSYTGNGSATGPTVNLGFEPQFLLVKNATGGNWVIADTMRSFGLEDMASLYPNASNAESTIIAGKGITPTATGFQCIDGNATTNQNAATHIYIAIRRGPMAVPESATDVFDVNQTTSNQFVTTGFPVDLQLGQYTGGGSTYVVDRMRGMSTSTTGSMKYLITQNTNAEASNSGTIGFNGFVQNGFSHTLNNNEQALWSWRRAPNYFDIAAYTGTGSALTVNHNLGVEPDMIWIKDRSGANAWIVQGKVISPSNNSRLEIDNDMALSSVTTGVTSLSSTTFSIGNWNNVNFSGNNYIAYLFASLAGVSKVGSYTGNGTNQTINCGFSAGARFILIKRTDSAGNWYIWDTERGIISGNDPYLILNNPNAEVTTNDSIDPDNSGFIVNQVSATNINVSSASYIFYAVS